MKVKELLERICYGPRATGEPIGEAKLSTTIPGLVERPTETEWRREFNVSGQYSRFNPTGQWYGDESPKEYNHMLRDIITGSRQ